MNKNKNNKKVTAMYSKNNPDLKVYPIDTKNDNNLRLVDDEPVYKIDKKDE